MAAMARNPSGMMVELQAQNASLQRRLDEAQQQQQEEGMMLHYLICQMKLVDNLTWQNKFLEKKNFMKH